MKLKKLRCLAGLLCITPLAHSSDELSAYITNGVTASTSTYQDFVGLYYSRAGYDNMVSTKSLCGGTMLDSTHVLTAAHCIFNNGSPNTEFMLFMVVGQIDNESNWPNNTTTVMASEFYYYSSFSDSSSDLWANDIAIIKLVSNPNVSGVVSRPADDSYRNASNTFTTIGHGNTKKGVSTYQLYSTNMTYVDNATCATSLSALSSAHICFKGASTDAGTGLSSGICSGDSGGPIYWDNGGSLVQIGITSFGPSNCGTGLGSTGVTGVFTEVADYQTWIDNVLSGATTPNYTATVAARSAYYNGLVDGTYLSFLNGSSDDDQVSPASGGGGGAMSLLIGFSLLGLIWRRRDR